MIFLIGSRLKELRENANMSQVEVAKLLMVKPATISRYENGVNEPDAKALAWYAGYFNVSLDWIFGLVDDPKQIKIPHPEKGGVSLVHKDIDEIKKKVVESPEFADMLLRAAQEVRENKDSEGDKDNID